MKRKNLVFLFLGFLVFSNILTWLAVYEFSSHQFLEVIFFDLGQGEAIFIETPKRHQVLIDGGPDSKILKKLGREMPFWDRNIDLLILTHPEYDHLVGLIEVLKRYRVENIFWTGVKRDTSEWQQWQKLIESQKEKGAKLFIAQAGQRIKLEESVPSIFIEILYPLENLDGQRFKKSNETSIVAKLIYSQNSFLFTGDISKSDEERLIEENSCPNSGQCPSLAAKILKVAHHGSKTSSSDRFIEKVLPEIAVISVGKDNQYGHPHQEVLETLKSYDITILRTDRDGDIKIISKGKDYRVNVDK